MEKLLAAGRPRAGDPREAAVQPGARGPRCCGALRPSCQEMEYSVSTEQMLIFFLAVWFFYFFYLQDFF